MQSGESDVLKNGVPVKVCGAFIESDEDVHTTWPEKPSERVEILGTVEGDDTTLLALYLRPPTGGDIGDVTRAVRKFYERSGIRVDCTSRAMSVIDDIVVGMLQIFLVPQRI